MKNVIYLSLFLIIISCSSKKDLNENYAFIAAIDSIMDANFLPDEPGAAIIITKGGNEIYKKAFGMANLELGVQMKPKMIFRLGSMTKQFTAVAILLLEEQGKLSVKDDICKYLPEYPTHDSIITIEHLLTHTSGIPSFTGFPNGFEIEQMELTTSELLDLFKSKPLDFKPGEYFTYSNSGYAVLGAVIESVSKMTYEEFIETEIFKKLDMQFSFYDHPKEVIKNKILGYDKDSLGYNSANYQTMCAPFSAGGLRSNVEDLAIWNNAIHNGELISEEILAKAFMPFELSSGGQSNYGFGWSSNSLMGHTTYHHGGGIFGFVTSGFYFPKEDLYIATLSNNTSSNPQYVNFLISSLLLGENNDSSFDNSKEQLEAYVGTYDFNGNNIIITYDTLGLLFSVPWQKGKLIVISKDEFYVDGSITACSFKYDSLGSIEKIMVKHRFFGDEWFTGNRQIE